MEAPVPHPISDALLDQVAHRLALLGQPLRIRMIERLELDGELTVQALADALDATQQNMSRHLALLYDTGIVDRRQAGRQVWYRLVDRAAIMLLDEVGEQVVNRISRPSEAQRSDRAAR